MVEPVAHWLGWGEARGSGVGEIEGIQLLEKRIGYRRPSKK